MSGLSVWEFAGELAIRRNGDGLGNLARHLRDSTGELVVRLAEFSDEIPDELMSTFRELLKEALRAPGAPQFETNPRVFECLHKSASFDDELRGLIEERVRVVST